MSDTKVKIATEACTSVETQSEQEERQNRKTVNKTFAEFQDESDNTSLRSRVMAAYKKSLERYGKLYEKLAK